MEARRTALIITTTVILAGILLAGLIVINYRYALNSQGVNDFLPRWMGTRLFIMRGQSPYSLETTEQIQRQIYGRPASPSEDQALFMAPYYAMLVYAPIALIKDYPTAMAVFMTVLEVSLFLMMGIGLVLSRWRPPNWLLAVLVVFLGFWYYSIHPVLNASAALLAGVYIAGGLWALRSDHDVLCGFLIALASFRPQIVALLAPLLLFWAVSNRRWLLFWSFFSTLFVFLFISFLFQSDWWLGYLRQVWVTSATMEPSTPGQIFARWFPGVGKQLGWALSALMTGILLLEWYQVRLRDTRWLLWTAWLTLAITPLIGIPSSVDDFVALFPGIVLVLSVWHDRWNKTGLALIITSLVLLFFGVWGLFYLTFPVSPLSVAQYVLFFPLPVFMVIGLYWTRWWAVRPPPPLMDQLRSSTQGGVL